MSKYMFCIHPFYGTWKMIRLRGPRLSATLSRCHTVVLRRSQQKGASSNQVTKRLKKRRSPCQQVLAHFDQQYSQELGDLWESARSVLLDPRPWPYGVMLNRFGAETELTQILRSQGFSSLQPQTDGSKLLLNGLSTASDSTEHAEGVSLLALHHLSRGPINDSQLQPYGTPHVLVHDPLSEPSFSLHPPSLQCYINPCPVWFPSQTHIPGQLKQYYLLNAASLLPVLALHVRDGEKVLDLCSAPGGKAVAIMQGATPALLCCNEPDPHRRDWLVKTLESFLPNSLSKRVIVSAQDGRSFGQSEKAKYDKVLVDAPCSNDRSWLYSSNSQQGEQRLKERARLPALQVQLLRSALSAVRPGGVVVYSTCTLSSSENHAVVETVLNDCPEAEPEDLWKELALPLSNYFSFSHADAGRGGEALQKPHLQPHNSNMSSYHHRLGILVVPQPGKSWGPMFVCRIRRKK